MKRLSLLIVLTILIGGRDLRELTWKDSALIFLGGMASLGVHEMSHIVEGDTNSARNGRAGFLGTTLVNLGLYLTPQRKSPFHFGFSIASTLGPLQYEPHTHDLKILEDSKANWKLEKYGFTAINALLTAPIIKITW